MKLGSFWVIGIAFFLLISSCKKIYPPGCYALNELPDDYPYSVVDWNYVYQGACFNPNNPQEFTSLKGKMDDSNESYIVVINQQTGHQNIIFSSDDIWDPPQWSVKNWIVFDRKGAIWKIKSNGDSLTQLTFTGSKHNPSWNPDGSKIIYHSNEQITSKEIIDENGLLLKDLPHGGYTVASWGEYGYIASSIGHQVTIFDETIFNRKYFSLPGEVYGLAWIDSSHLLCCVTPDIVSLDIKSGITSVIKNGCDTKAYRYISISSNKEKIITQTGEFTVNNKAKTIEGHLELYTMNIDGTHEEHIDLPVY